MLTDDPRTARFPAQLTIEHWQREQAYMPELNEEVLMGDCHFLFSACLYLTGVDPTRSYVVFIHFLAGGFHGEQPKQPA